MTKRILVFIFIFPFIFTLIPIYSADYTGSVLLGRATLFIPESGSLSYTYTPCLIDREGNTAASSELFLGVSELPDGINFDPVSNTVTVFDNAKPGTMFTFTLSSQDTYPDIRDKSYTVRLTDNLIVNSTFLDTPYMSGWDIKNSSPFTTDASVIKFEPGEDGAFTYFLTQEEKLSLEADTLYQFSCEIKTSSDSKPDNAPNVYSEIIGQSAVSYIENPYYPSWTKLTFAFRPSEQGEYIFSIAAVPGDEMTSVHIKHPLLHKVSGTTPSELHTSVPQAINIPGTDSVTVPFSIWATDIEGNKVPASIGFDIKPKTDSITIDENSITVSSDASPGVYKVNAYALKYPDIVCEFSINLNSGGVIANGDFEGEGSDSLWFAPGDGEYEVIKDSKNSYASFTPNAEIGVMYNNAYVSFNQSQSYVFSADLRRRFSDKSAYVTFIVEDSLDPDNLQLCAYFEISTAWENYKAVFTPETDLSGRFIVAVNVPEGFDEQTVYLDNISVVPAAISAENVKITGTPRRGNTVKGSFDFVNNFDGESASITNWIIADTPQGEYKTLSYSNVSELEITEDMEGKYLIFEVTPISLTAGILGDTVRSEPLKIPKKTGSTSGTNHNSSDESKDTSNEKTDEKNVLKDSPSYISPVNLSGKEPINVFADLNGHWAEDEIGLAYSAGLISGYSDNTFMPQKEITRAEFCAFLMRALGLEEGVYSGKYSDVAPQSWYAGVIQTMQNCSLVNGVEENIFMPNAPITRQQAVTIIMRAYSLIKGSVPEGKDSFTDSCDLSDYSKEYVNSAALLGITKGDPDGNFLPDSFSTRAEALTLITRFLSSLI